MLGWSGIFGNLFSYKVLTMLFVDKKLLLALAERTFHAIFAIFFWINSNISDIIKEEKTSTRP